jgi:Ca2+-binding RTX toxin-like protein
MSQSIFNSLISYANTNIKDPLKVMKGILAWAGTSYSPFGAADPEHAWNDNINITYGSCGWRWILMSTVLKHAGIETRRVSFFDVPVQDGHVAGEVKVAGKWILVDPTTGMYFQDKYGRLLSAGEVREKWADGEVIGKIQSLPAATGVAADIWTIDTNNYKTLTDSFIRHPGFQGRDDVIIAEAQSLYTSNRATFFENRTFTPIKGGNTTVVLDILQNKPWDLVQRHYDTKGRLDSMWMRYDNETGTAHINDFKFVNYDSSGVAAWTSKTTYLNETFFLHYRSTEWRDGTRTVESFDHASNNWLTDQAWITRTFSRFTNGKRESALTYLNTGDIVFTQGQIKASYLKANDLWTSNINIIRGDGVLIGTPNSDLMIGGNDNNIYYVDAGDIVLEEPNNGTDTVSSSVNFKLAGNIEHLYLTASSLNGYGNELNNTIVGNNHDNYLSGGGGRDWLYGQGGNDSLVGGYDSDSLSGGTGDDILLGEVGNDTLNGGAGNDTLNGGLGKDVLYGGLGADYFVFDTALSSSSTNVIKDFATRVDKLVLDDDVFKNLVGKGTLGSGNFIIGTRALQAYDYLIYNTTNDMLYFDADGSGSRYVMVEVAKIELAGSAAPTYTDFIVVS